MTIRATTESEFLAQRAAEAKAGIGRAFALGKDSVRHAVDPRRLAQAHPFMALGGAMVAGIAAVWVAVPSKRQKANDETVKAKPPRKWRKQLLRVGFRLAKPMIIRTITTALSGAKGGNAGPGQQAGTATGQSPTEPLSSGDAAAGRR
ncbi:MAG: hypothetical protein AAGD32_01350 [Planctomycetota bacterium]